MVSQRTGLALVSSKLRHLQWFLPIVAVAFVLLIEFGSSTAHAQPARGDCAGQDDGTACTDDGNQCTADECSSEICVHPPLPIGTACGNPADTSCDNPDTCDGLGTCLSNMEPPGTPCASDGNACTVDECAAGVCAHPAVDCSLAGDQCNDAFCDPGGGEGNCDTLNPANEGLACDDGQFCTVGETCMAGTCGGGSVTDCSAQDDQCNVGVCNETNDACEAQPINEGLACDDGLVCTEMDVCTAGSCGGSSVDCSGSGDDCNVASCDPGGLPDNCDTLTPTNEGMPCDGGTGACSSGVCVPSACLIYVDVDANLVPFDGSDWCHAYRRLQDALDVALPGDSILVAQGTYLPTEQSCTGDGDCDGGLPNQCIPDVCVWDQPRTRTFQLLEEVEVKGGYAGCGEPDPDARDIVNTPTVISGDLDSNDIPAEFPDGPSQADNSYHVVTASGTNTTAKLSGCTVEAGNANNFLTSPSDRGAGILGGSATIRQCVIQNNYAELGAGGFFGDSETPVFIQCTIRNNIADGSGGGLRFISGGGTIVNCNFINNSAMTSFGGGVHGNDSNLTIVNSIFYDNTSTGGGGASFNNGSTAVIGVCTFAGNTSTTTGGGIAVFTGAEAIIENTILWGNSDSFGMTESGQISVGAATAAVNFSVVEGDWTGIGGVGILDIDPLFEDLAGGDLHLKKGSPAIDAGNAQALPDDAADLDGDGDTAEPTPLDLDGNVRVLDDATTVDTGIGNQPFVDLGAFELSRDCNGNTIEDACELDCGPAMGPCNVAGCGTAADCNLNGVLDECDDPIDGMPDECVDWAGGESGNFSDSDNWPGGIVPVIGFSVTLDGSDGAFLDDDFEIDSLRILEDALLEMTAGDLTLDKAGGLRVEGTIIVGENRIIGEPGSPGGANIQILDGGKMTVNDSTIATTGSLAISSNGQFLSDEGQELNNTTVISAHHVFIRTDSSGPGEMSLDGNMSLHVTGNLVIDGSTGTRDPLPRGGNIPPIWRMRTQTAVAVDGNFTLVGGAFNGADAGAEVEMSSTQPMQLGGSFQNLSRRPEIFDFLQGSLTFTGSTSRRFEVAGDDVGASPQGRIDNFAMGQIEVPAGEAVLFTDDFDNTGDSQDACTEALYVDTLILGAGASVTIDDCRVYYGSLVDNVASISFSGCGELIPRPPVSPLPPPPPHDILKNRYLSIDPRGVGTANVGHDFDIRVTLSSTLVNGVTAVGSQWWANAPDTDCIAVVGPTRPAEPTNWDACPTLHLTGCPIIPTSTYDISVEIGGLLSDPPLVAATQAKPGVKWHGDCVGFFDGTVWTPPNFTTSIDDAVAAIKTFQDINALNATHVSVTDMVPNLTPGPQINLIVNIADVFSIILGFQGQEYPGPEIEICPEL